MALEYVVVHLEDGGAARHVYVDGGRGGETGDALQMETGFHTFALCDCIGTHVAGCNEAVYTPVSQDVLVRGTTRLSPLEVRFELA
jgi:hypothetical protein